MQVVAGDEQRVQLVKIAADSQKIGVGPQWAQLLEGVVTVVLSIGMQTNKVPVLRPDGTELKLAIDSQVSKGKAIRLCLCLTGLCLCLQRQSWLI